MGDELERFVGLRDWLRRLDGPHRQYALGYAEQLSLGEPAPPTAGLDRAMVREIRLRVWQEWRRRIDAMPGKRRPV